MRGRARRGAESASTHSSATPTASAGGRASLDRRNGRSWLWLEDDVVLFKAEASAWTPAARAAAAGSGSTPVARRRKGYARARGMRDLCRLLLETTPVVTLFAVRSDNEPAIGLYESIGMQRVRSAATEVILFPVRIVLARHAESEYSALGLLNGDPESPVSLTLAGLEQARQPRRRASRRAVRPLRHHGLSARRGDGRRGSARARGAATRRARPRTIRATGRYEGRPLAEYRAWAAATASSAIPEPGGESRLAVVERYAPAFRTLLPRPEESMLVVAHTLPVAYALEARAASNPPSVRSPARRARDAVSVHAE